MNYKLFMLSAIVMTMFAANSAYAQVSVDEVKQYDAKIWVGSGESNLRSMNGTLFVDGNHNITGDFTINGKNFDITYGYLYEPIFKNDTYSFQFIGENQGKGLDRIFQVSADLVDGEFKITSGSMLVLNFENEEEKPVKSVHIRSGLITEV